MFSNCKFLQMLENSRIKRKYYFIAITSSKLNFTEPNIPMELKIHSTISLYFITAVKHNQIISPTCQHFRAACNIPDVL